MWISWKNGSVKSKKINLYCRDHAGNILVILDQHIWLFKAIWYTTRMLKYRPIWSSICWKRDYSRYHFLVIRSIWIQLRCYSTKSSMWLVVSWRKLVLSSWVSVSKMWLRTTLIWRIFNLHLRRCRISIRPIDFYSLHIILSWLIYYSWFTYYSWLIYWLWMFMNRYWKNEIVWWKCCLGVVFSRCRRMPFQFSRVWSI